MREMTAIRALRDPRAKCLIYPDRNLLGLLSVAVLAASALGVVPALLLQMILDRGVGAGRADNVIKFGVSALGAAIAESAFRFFQQWLSTLLSQRQICRLRQQMFEKLQRLPHAYFADTPSGVTIARFTADASEAQNLVSGVLPQILAVATSLIVLFVTMLTISWHLTVLALVLVPAILLPATIVGKRLRALNSERLSRTGALTESIAARATAPGSQLMRLIADDELEARQFANLNAEQRSIGMSMFITGALYASSVTLLGSVASSLIYLFGGIDAVRGSMTVGEIVALSALAVRLYGPIDSLASIRVQALSSAAGFERVLTFLALGEESSGSSQLPNDIRGQAITARNLRVGGTPSQRHVRLRNVSLSIPAGQWVAIVGPSGSGKSTLLETLVRLAPHDAGEIQIGGIDIEEVNIRDLRRNVGLLTQSSHFLNMSIRENLLLAGSGASDSELEAACRAAHVWDTVSSLEDGLDTLMGDHGDKLSGGERQRLAMARLLLRNPQIVLLDEPTAHLDEQSEKRFWSACCEALEGRTVVIVTHHLSSTTLFDRLIVVERGTVSSDAPVSEIGDLGSRVGSVGRQERFGVSL